MIKNIILKYKRLPFILFILITLTILVLTLFPAKVQAPFDLFSFDKVGHLLLFGTWTFLYGLTKLISNEKPPNYWIIFLLGAVFGLVIELLQHFLPTNRSPELHDFIADIIGSGIAILALKITYKRLFKNESVTLENS